MDNNSNGWAGVLVVLLISSSSAFVTSRIYESNPQAIDVYQGKTTLETTYRDGVAVDSVVVWKEEYINK